jgi:hypothetical protein
MKQLNIKMDDDEVQRAKIVKAHLDVTWDEFVEQATECLADEYGIDLD